MLSFNSPFGACPEWVWSGTVMRISPETVIPNPDLVIRGALYGFSLDYWNTMGASAFIFSTSLPSVCTSATTSG